MITLLDGNVDRGGFEVRVVIVPELEDHLGLTLLFANDVDVVAVVVELDDLVRVVFEPDSKLVLAVEFRLIPAVVGEYRSQRDVIVEKSNETTSSSAPEATAA